MSEQKKTTYLKGKAYKTKNKFGNDEIIISLSKAQIAELAGQYEFVNIRIADRKDTDQYGNNQVVTHYPYNHPLNKKTENTNETTSTAPGQQPTNKQGSASDTNDLPF